VKTKATKDQATTGLVPKLRFPEFRKRWRLDHRETRHGGDDQHRKSRQQRLRADEQLRALVLWSQQDKFGRVIAGDSYKNYLLLKPNDFAYNKSATKEYPEGFLTLYAGTELAVMSQTASTPVFKHQR
jgi:type I restriction enzyme S subunit